MGGLFRSQTREDEILHSLCQKVSAEISSSEGQIDIKPHAADEGNLFLTCLVHWLIIKLHSEPTYIIIGSSPSGG